MDKARTAFEFVRDEIPHSLDIQADKIAVCASDVLAAGVGTLREMGFTRFYLWVLRDNVRARSFYERMGMRCSGEEKIDRIGGMDAVEVRYVGEL